MSQLIDGILDYSAVDKGISTIERVDVADLLIEIKEDLQLSYDQISCENELPVLQTYPLPLKQVLINLISNAVRYHSQPEVAVVNVVVEEFPTYHLFSVSDTGPGIDPRYHTRIFDVFETLNTNKEIDSTGVGLAIVKKIIHKHGGEIRLISALGKGSTFTFTWPKTQSETLAVTPMKRAS